jgi:preprotein translocase subunit SecG
MFLTYLCTTLLLLTGFLLTFIVLLQRGRGGGLAGAFGGLGGQSAFGTKAGDVFTKITIVLAIIWVSLAGVTGFAMRYDAEKTSFKSGKKPPENPEVTTPTEKPQVKPGKSLFPKQPAAGLDDSGKPDKPDVKKNERGKPAPDLKSKDKSPDKTRPKSDDAAKKPKSKP